MMLDLFSVTLVTALVIVVSAVLYLTGTLLRKDGAAGKSWAVAFLAGVLTVISYLVWAAVPSAFVAVAIGNAGFVASAAFMWLGCLSFNSRRLVVPAVIVGVGITGAFLAALVAGPDGGDWAGAPAVFIGVAAFAGVGAAESRRGRMGSDLNVIGLTVVLGVEAVFFVVRTVVFFAAGPESDLFQTWFDSRVASLLTVVLTIVALVTASVLRAGESSLRGQQRTVTYRATPDGVLLPAAFEVGMALMLSRSADKDETLCVVAVRMDDLDQVATAFGPAEAEAIAAAWRTGVRRYAPTASLVGERDARTLLVAFPTTSYADVRRIASIMHRRLVDDIAMLGVSVVPVIGAGIALTSQTGYDAAALTAAAEDAALRSSSSPDASIIVAGS